MKEIVNKKMKRYAFNGLVYKAKSKADLRRKLGIGYFNPKPIRRVG